jgi:hypothetical protein
MLLKTIKSSHYEADLLVAKSLIEDNGITCYLKNENTTQVLNHMANFYVELQVEEKDYDKALGILEEGQLL